MIEKLYFYESLGFEPCKNLAIEETLLEMADNCLILYLWQNENTVVIGKNQNPWKECRTTLLKTEGGSLVRRLSGGGAVFHDLGNLNFTFLMNQSDYNLDKQLTVIEKALQNLGIETERSGRNDILVCGRKFSGNAFYKNGKHAYHHGTLLVHADMQKLGRYLSPSKMKLQAKGVDSVRSRVANLCEWKPDLTITELKGALKAAVSSIYNMQLEKIENLDEEKIKTLTQRNQSWEWNYGRKIPFTCSIEGRFSWGGIEIALKVDYGKITEAKVYSDAMETAWTENLEEKLQGCVFDKNLMCEAIVGLEKCEDICELLEENFCKAYPFAI